MKILVAYYSETGNTKQVAQAMYGAASTDHEVTMSRIKEVKVDELTDYDLLILGSCCHDADLARPFKYFLDILPQNPPFKLAGFFTHATFTPEHTKRRKQLFARWAGRCGPTFEHMCQEKKIDFLGYFHCMGAASEPIEAFIRREIITSDEEWKEYQPDLITHPNSKDLDDAKRFIFQTIEKLSAT
jgi:flavodoxin